jgi:hypothetical protein
MIGLQDERNNWSRRKVIEQIHAAVSLVLINFGFATRAPPTMRRVGFIALYQASCPTIMDVALLETVYCQPPRQTLTRGLPEIGHLPMNFLSQGCLGGRLEGDTEVVIIKQ